MAMAVLIIYSFPDSEPSMVGAKVATWLDSLMGMIIGCFVAPMAADCLASEKRNGTLGLLFLTPLSARGIVVGKTMTHILRALTLCVATFPVLIIPVLQGGFNARDFILIVVTNFCYLSIALGVGLLASSITEKRTTAWVLASIGGVLGVIAYYGIICLFWAMFTSGISGSGTPQNPYTVTLYTLSGSFIGMLPGINVFLDNGAFTAASSSFYEAMTISLLTALTFLLAVIYFAGYRLRASINRRPRTAREEKVVKEFCTPILPRFYNRARNWSLNSNPVVWLEQYSWKARMTKWGLCFLFMGATLVHVMAGFNLHEDDLFFQYGLLGFLALMISYAGVNTFYEAKKTGTFELLLSTPLTPTLIIWGRVFGLWKQMLPALVMLGIYKFIWFGSNIQPWGFDLSRAQILALDGVVLTTLLALPLLSTLAALEFKSQLAALFFVWGGLTLSALLVMLAVFVFILLMELALPYPLRPNPFYLTILLWVVFLVLLEVLTFRKIEKRMELRLNTL